MAAGGAIRTTLATLDGWTVERLALLKDARSRGLDLTGCAGIFTVSTRAVDIALNSLTGRTPTEAFEALYDHEAALCGLPPILQKAADAAGYLVSSAVKADAGRLTLTLHPWRSA